MVIPLTSSRGGGGLLGVVSQAVVRAHPTPVIIPVRPSTSGWIRLGAVVVRRVDRMFEIGLAAVKHPADPADVVVVDVVSVAAAVTIGVAPPEVSVSIVVVVPLVVEVVLLPVAAAVDGVRVVAETPIGPVLAVQTVNGAYH